MNFFLRMPIYLAVGMAGSVAILFFVGHLLFNLYVILLLLGFFWFIFLYEQKVWVKLQQLDLSKILSGLSGSVKLGLVPLSLFLFSLCHFVFIAYSMRGWCPPGDCVWHGMRVSLIKNYQNIAPTNISSPWNIAISPYYPKGFYMISVVASLLMNVYPGEAVLIAATSISILVPPMLYTMVYTKTKSKFFSFVAFLMVYIVPGGNPYLMRSYSVFASYLNGVYPRFFGVFLVITFIYVVTCLGDLSERSMFRSKRHMFLVFVLALSIVITYYSFFLFFALYLLVTILLLFGPKLRRIHIFKKFLLVTGLVIVVCTIFFQEITILYSSVRSHFLSYTWMGRWLPSYWVPFSVLYSNLNGFLILICFFLSLIFLIYSKHQFLDLLYLFFAAPLLLSTINYEIFVDFLWMISPFSALIALILFSYVVLAIFLNSISTRLMRKAKKRARFVSRKNKHESALRILMCSAVAVLFILLIYPSFTVYVREYEHFGDRPVGDDYDALVWIDKNVAPEDLILNDRSMIGLFIPSFSIKNVVSLPEPDWPKPVLDRMLECFSIFDDPANTTYINMTLRKYNIKYVFVSSLDFYYDFWDGYEYFPPVVHRPYTASEILGFFDSSPDLFYREFRRESVGVYRVLSSS